MKPPEPSKKLALGQRLAVKIEGLGSLGEGLSHFDGAEIFTPKTMRGDEVEIEIKEFKKGRFRGEVKKFITESPDREDIRCQHFSICGGCDFQGIPYDEQIEWKLRMTKHWIRRSSLAPILDKISFDLIESPLPFAYRHRVRLQVQNRKIHFFKPHSHNLFEIKDCPILVEGFLDALKEKASELSDTRDWNQSFSDGGLVDSSASYSVDGEEIQYDADCFTQGNLSVNELIWKRIKEDVLSLESRRVALDLFCGVGNFSVPLSRYFEKVIGVESEGKSIEWARQNSSKVEWHSGTADSLLSQFEKTRMFFDFVLLDPPRAGALSSVRTLNQLMPPAITYVSCHLESLVHDLVVLTKHGGYKIQRWTVADMFPQTHHIESVVSLRR